MILDGIIGFFGSLIGVLAEGAAGLGAAIINAVASGVEAVVGLFVTGFKLGRVGWRKRAEAVEGQGSVRRSQKRVLGGMTFWVMILGVLGWSVIGPVVMTRKITLVAEDGHSLPFAALVVHTRNGDEHLRTDNAGHASIPRFATSAVTVKDPRYVEQTWSAKEIERELIVKRTVLGAGLDGLVDRLMRSATE